MKKRILSHWLTSSTLAFCLAFSATSSIMGQAQTYSENEISTIASETDSDSIGTPTDCDDALLDDALLDVTLLDEDLLTAPLVNCNYTLTGNTANYNPAITPYGLHGKLSVSGTHLIDEKGNPVQLRGVSLAGIQHTNGGSVAFKDYVNRASFQILRDEWGVNLIRIPVYTAENGYCQGNQTSMDTTIQNAVSIAKELGMYVIIDWHILSDGDPRTYQSQAVTFFQKYTSMYAGYGNVLYEICNEPNSGLGWAPIKQYALSVIPQIRAYDKDAIIIVGTPNWSQLPNWNNDVDVSNNPITNRDLGGNDNNLAKNVLYTMHFYAASHYDQIQGFYNNAISKGLPVFVTEFGICDETGNGRYDIANANKWMSMLDSNYTSYCCWSLCNKNESSAMFMSSCNKLNSWTNSDLNTTGAWYINMNRPKYDTEMANYQASIAIPLNEVITDDDTNAMYRLYNPNSGEHFYTANYKEAKNTVAAGWRYEGIAWYAPKTGDPVYRLYNKNAGDHHYTLSAKERDSLVASGWAYEGIAWYSGGSVPMYRAYNPNALAGSHHYSTSKKEINNLVSVGWRYEGTAWSAVK